MLMNSEELLKYYNDYFAWLPDYEAVNPFVVEEVENEDNADKQILFVGKISSKLAKCPLEIDVKIPLGFPNEKISLTTTSLRNYAHLIPNKDESSWFCLNTPFCETIEEQLDLEMERLSGWIDKYLNKGEPHEALPFAYRDSEYQLFYVEEEARTADEIRLKDVCWGVTDCYKNGNKFYPTNLGNKSTKFCDAFDNSKSFKKDKLFWLFTDTPPLDKNGHLVSELLDLQNIVSIPKKLSKAFEKKFHISLIKPVEKVGSSRLMTKEELEKYFERYKNMDEEELTIENMLQAQAEDAYYENQNKKNEQYKNAFLAIGYILNNEIVWELAKCVHSKSININKSETDIYEHGWQWNKSVKIDHESYFGRGHFCEQLTKSKIAIIGIGAIGSSLAEILTRGGATHLHLIDNDIVEHGNICRSSYFFTEVGNSKVQALADKLERISPFLFGEISQTNLYSEVNYASKNNIKDFLSKVDIIFDCTASNELLHCLSMLDLKKPIISFGITNEARDMICVTNSKDNLFEQRKFFLKQLEHDTENLYYEGIGCYTPTFRANFADINSLLNLAVKHIDKSFSEKETVDSFVLSHTDNGIAKDNIVTFSQKELGFTLSISQHCLDEIKHYSYMHYPLEFGGYLLGGYSRDMKRIYLTNILIAENKINGRAFFQPINNSTVHKKITKIFEKTQGLINYIGEWHTHPEMGNFYSGTDFDSIKKQAKSKNIFTNNPLLCVVSVGRRFFEPKFYIYYNNDLYEFVK